MKTIQEIDQSKFRVPISELRPGDNYKNVMDESIKKLMVSLMEDGQLMPILVDARKEQQGKILGGNHQYFAIKKLIEEERWPYGDMVWVEPALPGNDKHAKFLALKHNTQYDLPDSQKLAEWAGDLLDSNYFLSNIPVMTADDYKEITLLDIFDQYGPGAEDVVEDEIPEVDNSEPVSKLGEVYQLGRHRLMCGDSTKIEDVEKLMNGQKVDMVFTDPPYGIEYDRHISDKKDFQRGIKNDNTSLGWLVNIPRGIPTYICTRWDIYPIIYNELKELGHIKNVIVWDKLSHGMGDTATTYAPSHEFIVYLANVDEVLGNRDRDIISVGRENGLHPTMKPVELIYKLLRNNSGDMVLDLFGGSGSTLIACEQLDRTCYMMELDPKYCDVIRKRYAKFIGREESWELASPAVYSNE